MYLFSYKSIKIQTRINTHTHTHTHTHTAIHGIKCNDSNEDIFIETCKNSAIMIIRRKGMEMANEEEEEEET